MGTSNADSEKTGDRRIFRRGLDRLERDTPVVVQYQSNRGSKSQKRRQGNILQGHSIGDGKWKFSFYDKDAERKIEVVLRETFEESKVRSQKTDTQSTVGTPIRVIVGQDCEDADEVWQQYLVGKRNKNFEPVAAAAVIAENESPLKWMKANGCKE